MPPRVVLMRADGTEPATGGEAGSSGAVASTATHNAQLSWMAAAEEEVRISRLRHSTIACGAHPVRARACLVRSSRTGGARRSAGAPQGDTQRFGEACGKAPGSHHLPVSLHLGCVRR